MSCILLIYRKQKEKISKMSEEEKKKLDEKSLLTLEEIQDQRKKEFDAFQYGDRLTGDIQYKWDYYLIAWKGKL